MTLGTFPKLRKTERCRTLRFPYGSHHDQTKDPERTRSGSFRYSFIPFHAEKEGAADPYS
jgi:hypothetical protein